MESSEFKQGSYELQAINHEIQKKMILNGDFDTTNNEAYITISANISELKSIVAYIYQMSHIWLI